MTALRELRATVTKLEKKVAEINKVLGILPPVINVLTWEGFNDRDRKVLRFLISQDESRDFTTTQIAEAIGEDSPKDLGRVRIHQSLERIRRISRRKRKTILSHSAAKRRRKWKMNRHDFTFKVGEAQ